MEIEVNVTEGKGVRRILEVRVPTEEVESEYKMAIDHIKSEAKIPGFRPGKAPNSVIQTKFKEEISRAVLENMLPKAFSEALNKADIEPVGEPEIKDVNIKKSEPLTFSAIVDVAPKVEPTGYTGLKLFRQKYEVTDEDVEKSLKSLQERFAIVNEVERPSQEGDIVLADIKKLRGGDNVGEEEDVGTSDVLLDKKSSLPDFVDNLTGMKVGDEVEFSVKYPDDYFEEKLAKYTFNYRAKVKVVRERLLPPIDEAFIERLKLEEEDGSPLNPEKLPKRIKKDLAGQWDDNIRRNLENQAVNLITEANNFDVPESLIEKYLDNVVSEYKMRDKNLDVEKTREKFNPTADKYVRWLYLRDAISEIEGLKVDENGANKYRDQLVKNSGMSQEDADKYLEAGNRKQNILDNLLEEKVLNFIIENAEIEDKHDESEGKSDKKSSLIINPEGK
ncbi:MAG: trigger factor [candidate division Zixibacteria bacterium]|nr:trigger factor [candidate division Zixibacteria bacterium]